MGRFRCSCISNRPCRSVHRSNIAQVEYVCILFELRSLKCDSNPRSLIVTTYLLLLSNEFLYDSSAQHVALRANAWTPIGQIAADSPSACGVCGDSDRLRQMKYYSHL